MNPNANNTPILYGVDYLSAVRLEGASDAILTIGARYLGNGQFDGFAQGVIDNVQWLNPAMCEGRNAELGKGMWAFIVQPERLRKFGGWAVALPNSVELHLERGWVGPIGSLLTPGIDYRIERRELGLTAAQDWVAINTDTRRNIIQDSSVTLGRWYEYRLPTTSKNSGHSIWGYAGAKPSLSAAAAGSKKYGIVVGVDSTLLSWEPPNGPLNTKVNEYVNTLKASFGASQVIRVNLARMLDDENGDGGLDRENTGTATEFAKIYHPGHQSNTDYKNALASNKTLIWNAFNSMPNLHTKIIALIGHVAVSMSGHVAEDGHTLSNDGIHPSHEGAWSCDAWYGVNPAITWLDSGIVPGTQHLLTSTGDSRYLYGLGGTTDGRENAAGVKRIDWELQNVPNDGKFDANILPSPLDAAVGRMDFSKMPGYTEPVDGTDGLAHQRREIRLTAVYLEKALAWRQSVSYAGNPNPPPGVSPMPAAETHCYLFSAEKFPYALPTQADLGGMPIPALSAAVRQNNGKPPRSGTRDLFFTGLPAWETPDIYTIWGIHGGYGSYDGIVGWYGNNVTRAENIRAGDRRSHSCVSILYGSYFGDWNHEPEDLGPIEDRQRLVYISDSNLQKGILAQTRVPNQPITGLITIYCRLGLNPSRAAAGFPVGCMMLDTSRENSGCSARCIGILGDPTLVLK